MSEQPKKPTYLELKEKIVLALLEKYNDGNTRNAALTQQMAMINKSDYIALKLGKLQKLSRNEMMSVYNDWIDTMWQRTYDFYTAQHDLGVAGYEKQFDELSELEKMRWFRQIVEADTLEDFSYPEEES